MNSAQTAAIQGTHLDDIVQRNVIVKELNSEELLQKAHSDIIKECQRKRASQSYTPRRFKRHSEFKKDSMSRFSSPRYSSPRFSTHMVEIAPNLVQTPELWNTKKVQERERNLQILNERLSKKKKMQGRGHYNIKLKDGQHYYNNTHSEEYLHNQQLLQQEFTYGDLQNNQQYHQNEQTRSYSQASFYHPSSQSNCIIGQQEPSHYHLQKLNHNLNKPPEVVSSLPKIDDNDKAIEQEIQSAFKERVKMLSGRIPFHEFEIALKQLNIGLERRMVRALYQKHKVDGVGINYEAFQEVVKEHSEPNCAKFTPFSETSRGSPLRSYSAHQSRFAPPTHSHLKAHNKKYAESFSSSAFTNHYHTPQSGSTIASSYYPPLKPKSSRSVYSAMTSTSTLSIECTHTRPTFEFNVKRIKPEVKVVIPQIHQKKYHPSMLVIPKVKKFQKAKTRDEERNEVIQKLLKDQESPSQLHEMHDKKFKRLKNDKNTKSKIVKSEKVYRTREDEKNQKKMKRRDRNTKRLAYDSLHYSGARFSKEDEFIQFKNLFDISKMTKENPTTRDRRLRPILSKDIDSLASPNTKETFQDKIVILMRGFKQYMSKEALYIEECRILVYQIWLGIEKYIESKEFGDGDLSTKLNTKVFRNINSQWFVLNKHHPEITNPTEEFKHCVLCVMLLLGQKKN